MSKWKEYKLTEVGTLKRGKSKHRPRYAYHLYGGKYPFIQTGEIKAAHKYISNYTQTYSEAGLAQSKLWPKGTLCITIAANIAEIAILGMDACFPDSVMGFIPDENKSNLSYVFYQLKHFQKELQILGEGSVQDNINAGTFEILKFPFPEINEQTAIAEVLSSLDDKIDLLHRQNKTLEQLAETLFRKWFVEEAEESWEETTLGKHTEVFRGLSYKGSGLTVEGDGLPMHNLNSIYEFGGYKQGGIKYYNGEYKERHLIEPGEIIVANTEQGHEYRLIGSPGIVPDTFGPKGLFSQHIYKLAHAKGSYLSTQFIYYLLMTPSVREQIVAATNGSTVNMLAIDGLQRPVFKLPPKVKVTAFTELVRNYWAKQKSNTKQISTLTQLRDTLLPKLMSGEVRVKMD